MAQSNYPDNRGRFDARPGVRNLEGNPSYVNEAANPPAKMPQGPTFLQPQAQETTFDPSQLANNKLISRDRHAFINRGTERTGRDSGTNDPILDGPIRPSLRTVNRTINFQKGYGGLTAEDDLTRAYTRDPSGRLLGEQDGSWSAIYGGVRGMWQPYGSYSGYTQGPVKGIQSPAEYLSPQDQPTKIFGGPPHGLHSPTFPDYSPTIGRYMATAQQRGQRFDRPSNSRIAGQSYSQTVAPQGEVGTVALQVQSGNPRNVTFSAGAGWRGA
jgi:hypothetical protein